MPAPPRTLATGNAAPRRRALAPGIEHGQRLLTRVLPLLAVLAGGTAHADEAALARSKNCIACHSAEKKLIGPPYKDIARKYAAQKDAEALLTGKILKGSKGVWGDVLMPPNATVKPDEAARLARWILGQR